MGWCYFILKVPMLFWNISPPEMLFLPRLAAQTKLPLPHCFLVYLFWGKHRLYKRIKSIFLIWLEAIRTSKHDFLVSLMFCVYCRDLSVWLKLEKLKQRQLALSPMFSWIALLRRFGISHINMSQHALASLCCCVCVCFF